MPSGYKLTTEDFIKRAIEIHGDKYDYSQVNFINSNTKVSIICKIHGEFLQKASSHINQKAGCPKCGNNLKKTLVEFIEEANKIHNNRYDYSLVNYINKKTNIKIICKIHGVFLQTPGSHIAQKSNCPKCNFEITRIRLTKTNEQFIKEAIKIHGNKYDYKYVQYVNGYKKVKIKCPKHNIFEQVAKTHLQGHGCPKCNYNGYSKRQIKWLEYISFRDNIKIQHAENEGEYKIENIGNVDGFSLQANTVFEFHGSLWHGENRLFKREDINPISCKTYGELYDKTIERDNKIKELGYNLVVCWEYDWIKFIKNIKLIQKKWRTYKNELFCKDCNQRFKTKKNLEKHLKSKKHAKNVNKN